MTGGIVSAGEDGGNGNVSIGSAERSVTNSNESRISCTGEGKVESLIFIFW